jgi:hypoxanthine-guanine phosphoribosyltransferase
VIEFSDTELRLLKATYASSDNKAEYGDWNAQWAVPEKENKTTTDTVEFKPITSAKPPVDTSDAKSENNVFVISKDGEEDILRALRDKGLYSWGRFATSGDQVLLSWVSVGPLLNVPELLGATVNDMSSWIENRLDEYSINVEEIVLIGIDCWGGVLASQISIITGATNFCVAARGRGEYHTSQESISDDVCEAVKRARAVVLVNDVVATGHTQKWVHDRIANALPNEAKDLKWLSLSVLADPSQPLAADCSFVIAHGTACRIKRPFLPADRVPPDDLVPTQISFV